MAEIVTPGWRKTLRRPSAHRPTARGYVIAAVVGASLAAIAALWPATVQVLVSLSIAGVLLLGVLACLPRGK